MHNQKTLHFTEITKFEWLTDNAVLEITKIFNSIPKTTFCMSVQYLAFAAHFFLQTIVLLDCAAKHLGCQMSLIG